MICSATDPPGVDLGRPGPAGAGQLQLVRPRRGRHVEGLGDVGAELLEHERAVVEGRREPEAVLDQRLLARAVAVVHPPDLRHGHVRLVDDHERVRRQIVHQGGRVLTGLPPRQVARVVLDAVAVPQLPEHLHVEQGPLLEPLRLEQAVPGAEEGQTLGQLGADRLEGPLELVGRRHVMAGRVDVGLGEVAGGHPAQGVDRDQAVERHRRRTPLGSRFPRRRPGRSPPRRRAPGTSRAGSRSRCARTAWPRGRGSGRRGRAPARPAAARASRGRSQAPRCRRCRTPTPPPRRPGVRTMTSSPSGACGRCRR